MMDDAVMGLTNQIWMCYRRLLLEDISSIEAQSPGLKSVSILQGLLKNALMLKQTTQWV